jgi:phage shock protein PspC (stress-responsive transcriptional regulator)
MVAGVAAGIAEHLDLDVTLVRIVLVVLAFIGGLAVPLYIAAWLLIPDEGSEMSVAEDLIDQFRSR